MTAQTQSPPKKPEDLLVGTLAVLALRGVHSLPTNETSFHKHFGEALAVFKEAGGEIADLSEDYYLNVVTNVYDQLDHALIAAERFNLVKFPNPYYSSLGITIPPKVAEGLVSEWGDRRDVLERAADRLSASISD